GSCVGAHPVSSTVSGAIVSDWTHVSPPQSLPAGTASSEVQLPSQGEGASKGVVGVDGTVFAHGAALAVSRVGRPHEPLGGGQGQAREALGASRSACPS